MPVMLGAGAVVVYFNPIIGSYIMNSAWLSNVAVFLCTNRAIRKVVKCHLKTDMQSPRGNTIPSDKKSGFGVSV